MAPGKRPLSSMSPTLVLKSGRPVASLGAAGGPTIISQVVQGLVWLLDYRMSPAEALAQPRIHHQWLPDELVVEKSLPADVKAALSSNGHRVREVDSLGACQIICQEREESDRGFHGFHGSKFSGSADPRVQGKAAGF